MIGRKPENGPQGSGVGEDGISFTLTEADRHGIAYAMTTGCYTQVCKEQSPTLQARDYKDAPVVNHIDDIERFTFGNNAFGRWDDQLATLKASGGDFPGGENVVVENRYIVRRLTPTECERLQGLCKARNYAKKPP